MQRIAWEAIERGYEEGKKQVTRETVQNVIQSFSEILPTRNDCRPTPGGGQHEGPYTAKTGLSGTWIEDRTGLSLCDFNPLLLGEFPEQIAATARLMAASHEMYAFLKAMSNSGKGKWKSDGELVAVWLQRVDEIIRSVETQ